MLRVAMLAVALLGVSGVKQISKYQARCPNGFGLRDDEMGCYKVDDPTTICNLWLPGGPPPTDVCPQPESHLSIIAPGSVTATATLGAQVTETFLLDNVRVWDELSRTAVLPLRAELLNVPTMYWNSRIKYSLSVPLSTVLQKNREYNFRCGWQPCEVVIFLYECHPCQSNKGNLPAFLLQEGFFRSRCAPTFTNGRTNTQHRLTAYSKLIDTANGPNYEYTLTLQEDVEFLMAGFSEAPDLDCGVFNARATCEDNYERCVWHAGRCERNTCVRQGPGKGCDTDTCLKKELL